MSTKPQRFVNLKHEQRIGATAFQSALADPTADRAKTEHGVGLWAMDALRADMQQRLESGKAIAPGDWADMQVARQLDAMGVDRFEVGVLKDKRMHLEVMDTRTVIYESANLRRLNLNGADIHIRPKEQDGYSLSLVDDVSELKIRQMKAEGFTPAVVVRTSPNNYQAWMRHGEVLSREQNSAAGKALAERFHADIGGSPAGHMGRLAGTTNQKEKHLTEAGKRPWVVVTEATGKPYEAAAEFVAQIKRNVELSASRYYAAYKRVAPDAKLKTIEDFRHDPRYGGDGNRVDFAFAMYARSKGLDHAAIAEQIRTRDLSHKPPRYVEYTISRAEKAIVVPSKSVSI